MTHKVSKKVSIPLLITLFLFVLFVSASIKIPEVTIRNIIQNSGSFGIVVFIFLTWITYFFAPLGATPFVFVGFYLYGSNVVFYSVTACLAASITNFWVSRILGKRIVVKLAGSEGLEKFNRFTTDHGLKTLLFLRIFLSGFHDIISYAFGLTSIKFIPYFIVTVIGLIPSTIFWYYLSSKTSNPYIFTALQISVAYILLSIFLISKKVIKKKG